MTELLLRLFVPNASLHTPDVHAKIGKLAGIVGIVCNVFLACLKLVVGLASGSVAIAGDGINNLTDSASSIVTLLGFRMAQRPADEEHPYGHARMEYLSGLVVAAMILVIGVELVKSSFEKNLHPTPVEFSALIIVVLVLSILMKLWMALFNRKLGQKIGSAALSATAADSRNDVIATGAVLLACVVGKLTGLRVDGYVGLLVALFIIWSGIGIAKDTIDPLLGAKPDEDILRLFTEKNAFDICTISPALPFALFDRAVSHATYEQQENGKIVFACVHAVIDHRFDPLIALVLLDEIERLV